MMKLYEVLVDFEVENSSKLRKKYSQTFNPLVKLLRLLQKKHILGERILNEKDKDIS
jgi:hypothetical protein